MDTIRFEIDERDDPANGIVDAVNVFVNGRNLVDILKEVELPFATREGKPHLAGSYVGLTPEEIFLPSPRLFGEPTTYYDHEVGCWPFRVKIALRDDVVIWSGFEQPHRAVWRYDEMRPFVFDRTPYLSALDHLDQEPG